MIVHMTDHMTFPPAPLIQFVQPMDTPTRSTARRHGATMQDVADLLHVSKQTVSAVVNNKPGITQETRDRVLAAIAQVNYRTDLRARSLRTGRTHSLAFVVADISSPVAGAMANAADERAFSEHYSLFLYNTHDDLEREQFSINSILQRSVDGVMFVSARDQSTAVARLASAGIPMVVIDRVPSDYTGPAVVLDNVAAGKMAARHLLDLGHRRFAHIGGPGDTHIARERLDGYRGALREAGAPDPAVELAEDWHLASGYDAMRTLLECGASFSAVYCAGDQLAIGAMRALRAAGVQVPEQVSVVGTDNIEYAAYFEPPLTTVGQPIEQMATQGVEMLLDMLNSVELTQTRRIIEPRMVVRSSTAPPDM
jgi:LacI family transcriptional regulator